MVQLKDKLTTQLDMIKQAQLKQNQQSSGKALPNSKSPICTNSAITKPQHVTTTHDALEDNSCTTTKALALSLGPSVAFGSISIPPKIITPPTIEQASSLSQPPVSFTRQVRNYPYLC